MFWKVALLSLLVFGVYMAARISKTVAENANSPSEGKPKELVRCPECHTLHPKGEPCSCGEN